MLIPRRPPWYRDRGVPCLQSADEFLEYVTTPFGEAVVSEERSLFQKWGDYAEVIDSVHANFVPDEWFEALDCMWVEIVAVDEMCAWRACTQDVQSHQSQSRLAGVDMVRFYLQVFRADRLRSLGDLDG